MATKVIERRPEYSIKTYQMHNFIRKMFQKDIFDKLIDYINWRIKVKEKKEAPAPEVTPISINLDLTTTCNYYCDHCIDLDIINSGHMLSLDNIRKLINRWVEKGLKSVIVIGGGEPVLHPDFEEVIAFFKSKGLELGIASNGSRVSKLSNITHLLNSRDWVRFSLDAGEDETFQKIHNPKLKLNLDQILAEVKKIRQKYSGYQMGFSFLILSDHHVANNKNLVNNIKEIPLAAKKARDSGFSYFSVKPLISPTGHRPTEFNSCYIKEIKEQVSLAKEFENGNFKVRESLNLSALFNNLNEKLRIQPKVCHSQFFRVVVAPDGVFNCTLWRGFEMSYLNNARERIDDEFFRNFRSRLLERIENFDAGKECSEVTCIYNDFNWFIEDMINNPEKLSGLKKTENFYDYFL